MDLPQTQAGNSLLRTLTAADYALLAPHFKRIPLPVNLRLHEAGRGIDRVYFPESGIISIVAVTLDGRSCEIGLFGREGMSETATVLGTDHSPHEAYVQVAGGTALRLPTEVLNEAFETSLTLRHHLLRYVQAMMIQLSSSIAAAGQTIEQRLARWLLMCHDRLDDDEVPLTHDFMAMMLGVRRAGVTTSLHALDQHGLIATGRGNVTILDRAGLEAFAAGAYGLAEAEYFRLIGAKLRRSETSPPATTARDPKPASV
ncbi:Crp/Fnr family transcriptional regulator [Sphingosinicellaceae bacterium]|nr:Crp/Fnr family transcriptional regulator [Sphingosinicellaceae bacterium]